MAYRSYNIEPKWILVFIFFLSGTFAGGLLTYLFLHSNSLVMKRLHVLNAEYAYVNPAIATEPAADYNDYSTVSKDLELKVSGLIDEAKAREGVTEASVYFRDFDSGTWLASNANMTFSPGILLKMPIMIAYFKLAEHDPSILNETMVFDGVYIQEQDAFNRDKPRLKPGKTYTVNDLLVKMMQDSDETAARLLFDKIDKPILDEVFSDLGVDFTEDSTHFDYITLKRYSIFFRALHNGTYLTPEYSEKALELLAQNKKNSLLEDKIPQSIPFINRIGGRTYMENGAQYQEVYECGLVYRPAHNYILCAAARGKNVAAIENLFKSVGDAVNSYMEYTYSQ